MPRNVPATAQEIADFESKYGVTLPAEMRAYYETVGATDMGDDSEAYMSFWPLWKVMPVDWVLPARGGSPDDGGIEYSLPDAHQYFVFMDHLIDSKVFAIQLSADPAVGCPVVRISDGKTWHSVATSFGDMLRIYNEDAWQLVLN